MRRVERGSVVAPASLTGAKRAGPKELERAETFYKNGPKYDKNGKLKKFTFGAYKGDDVAGTLYALFHGKCAYCEARYEIVGPVDIEHYRPKAAVKDEATHKGYWWLAAAWENLLPSCIDCNRRRTQKTPVDFASLTAMAEPMREGAYASIMTGKDTCFPVTGPRVMRRPQPRDADRVLGMEHPLLLNPCADNPQEHLTYWLDRRDHIGLVLPVASEGAGPALPPLTEDAAEIIAHAHSVGISERGAVSIQVYGLNRIGLVQERTKVLRKLEFLGEIVVDLFELAADIEDALPTSGRHRLMMERAISRLHATSHRILAEIRALAEPSSPFSEMVKQWNAKFIADLQAGR
jgi:hypothetical protein